MYVKNNTIYAEAGYYLRHRGKNIVGMSLRGDIEDFDELPLASPVDVVADHASRTIYLSGRLFCFRPPALDYDAVVAYIVKRRYSLDDQMAIVLNADRSDDDKAEFDRMQQWRSFAKTIAAAVQG